MDDWLVVDRLRLNRSTREVFSGSRRITLTPAEFAVLELLMTSGGHGVTRDAIRAAAARRATVRRRLTSMGYWPSSGARRAFRGRGRGVRSERAMVYFFGE